ncbi:hypothetical protein ACLOJK_021217 [Asimina triloba]
MGVTVTDSEEEKAESRWFDMRQRIKHRAPPESRGEGKSRGIFIVQFPANGQGHARKLGGKREPRSKDLRASDQTLIKLVGKRRERRESGKIEKGHEKTMSKPDDAENTNNPTTTTTMPWGTWEELLLACAVNRHGTKSWDSVAMELQNRATSPLLTPQNCRQKYLDLQRRFTPVVDGAKTGGGDGEPDKDDKTTIPWLEELRNLRVAELRREVQRYDLSIGSLQLKVKKLKEERERSLNEAEKSDGKPDLEKEEPKDGGDAEKERDGGDERPSPEVAPRKRTSGEESDRENQSFNESNSTDPKTGPRETEGEKRPEEGGKPDQVSGESPEEKAAASYNGSSDTVAKGAAAAKSPSPAARIPAPDPGESAEFRESVAESKGEGVEAAKESSDVQSSASLSRKKRRSKAVSGSSSGEEPEAEDVSPVSKRIPVKSQPLVGVLEIIRSHKHGSVFERRLDSQEAATFRLQGSGLDSDGCDAVIYPYINPTDDDSFDLRVLEMGFGRVWRISWRTLAFCSFGMCRVVHSRAGRSTPRAMRAARGTGSWFPFGMRAGQQYQVKKQADTSDPRGAHFTV